MQKIQESEAVMKDLRAGFLAYARSMHPERSSNLQMFQFDLETAAEHLEAAIAGMRDVRSKAKVLRLLSRINLILDRISESEGIPIKIEPRGSRHTDSRAGVSMDLDGMTLSSLRVDKTTDREGFVSGEDFDEHFSGAIHKNIIVTEDSEVQP